MSVPPVDLSDLNDYDAPDTVKIAFRRFRFRLIGVLLIVASAAAFAGYSVDKERTQSLEELLRKADTLQTHPVDDDVLPYFILHHDLAAAAGVESCSAFAIRMTERFLPEGWEFNADDVAAVRRGEDVDAIRLNMDMGVPVRWQC